MDVSTTVIDHQTRINRVLLHIQEHMDEYLSIDELAKIACFSSFHFHRIFRAYTGESVHKYQRRIRLERAALQLFHTEESITTIALETGFETSASFAKAFKANFQKTPSEFRLAKRIQIEHASFISQKSLSKEKTMTPEFRDLSEQTVLFVRKVGAYSHAASDAWNSLMRFAYPNRLIEKETQMIGISHDSPDVTEEDKLRYDACITIDKAVETEGEVGTQTIAGGRYAVFLHKGAYENFNQTYQAIYSGWLPQSGEKLRGVLGFERYLNRDPRRTKPENLRTEIFIPIQ